MADAQIDPEVAKGLAFKLVEQQPQIQDQNLSSLVDRAIQAYQDGQAEKSLQMLAGDVCPYTAADVKVVLLENLSSQERDPKTGQKKEPEPGTPEKTRYDESQRLAEAVRVYLESDGQNIPPELQKAIIDYISRSPLFKDVLFDQQGQLRQQEAYAIAQTLLRQPQYRRIIHRLFTERLDPKKRLEHIDAYEALRREIQVLEEQIDKLPPEVTQAEIDKAKDELEEARQELTKVSGDKKKLEILAAEAPQLRETLRFLRAQETRLRQNIAPIEQEIQALKSQLITAKDQNEINNINQQIQQRENDPNYIKYQSIKAQIATIEADLGEIDSLAKRITEAQSNFEQKKQEYEELLRKASSPALQERARLQAEIERKKLELQDLEAQLTAERIRYASDIIAIPAEAAKEFLNEALSQVSNHYKEIAAKEAEKKGKEEAQQVQTLAEKLARKKKGEIYLPDKKQARKILTLLMQPDGVTIFMNEIAKHPQNYGLTQSEVKFISDKIQAGDVDFIQNTGIALAKSVLADYLLAGGRLSRDDIIALGNADWVKTLIDEGVRIATEKRAQIEGLIGKGVLDTLSEIRAGHKNVDWLMSNWWKFGLGIGGLLLLIFLGLKLF